jgi:hypothetical protein
MLILPDISCDEFMDKVCNKFGREYGDLSIKFADEDGARITIIDESDFELAIETARNAASKGKESRLEIWYVYIIRPVLRVLLNLTNRMVV